MSTTSPDTKPPTPIDYSPYQPKCEWLDVPKSTKQIFDQDSSFSDVEESETFKILSFNILAQTLIRRDVFPTSSQRSLKWGTRRENLFAEIQVYGADVLCLQECDFYEEFWKPRVVENAKLNYGGGLWKRKEGNRGDGVAVIWNKNKFALEDHTHLEFDDFCKHEPYANNGQGSDLTELVRGNVAQIVALRKLRPVSEQNASPSAASEEEQSEGIIIFNTHLFWNPKYNYTRLVQVVIALEQIAAFKERTGLKWPVVMCGDYNHSSGDASYEALFHREQLCRLWAHDSIWLAPKLHYSKYQAWVVPPVQSVLDAEDPQPKPPQDAPEIESRFSRVKSLLNRLESQELPVPISIYRNYMEVHPDHPDWVATNQPSKLEPPFTAYSSFWCGPLDYIAVISPNDAISQQDTCKLVPHKLLRTPTASEIGPPAPEHVHSPRIPHPVVLPNDIRASDHLPIMVAFSIHKRSPNKQ